ncbi:SDR family oxidoreductase [Fulvivirga sedimenti]|uniref:SDR family oxidoreductase n=1 Tax=Fulvivirga sedimenti TaxID=2879465 RepID=A0A9X1HW43_9BACT|nr:SDR family oxidoreductase [Fulvivirga sedimenti]MCA6078143.1 SDR family oxidoreductase [Fulvivirga sedimenti]
MLDLSLKEKHAVVCGSTQGIGLAIAELFAAQGATITLMARDAGKMEQIVRKLPNSEDQNHDFIAVDFNDTAALSEVLKKEHNRLSTATILVNNSGGPPAGTVRGAQPDDFRIAFERHLIASQLLTEAIVPAMIREEFGRIINIISTSVKSPIPGLGVSNTIRGAVASWAKTLAGELGPFGITVNNVLPGATSTERLQSIIENKANKLRLSSSIVREEMIEEIPARRFADAREIAAAVAFLASREAGYINGINLPVDGGRLTCL